MVKLRFFLLFLLALLMASKDESAGGSLSLHVAANTNDHHSQPTIKKSLNKMENPMTTLEQKEPCNLACHPWCFCSMKKPLKTSGLQSERCNPECHPWCFCSMKKPIMASGLESEDSEPCIPGCFPLCFC